MISFPERFMERYIFLAKDNSSLGNESHGKGTCCHQDQILLLKSHVLGVLNVVSMIFFQANMSLMSWIHVQIHGYHLLKSLNSWTIKSSSNQIYSSFFQIISWGVVSTIHFPQLALIGLRSILSENCS